jgi:hypothetical protein
VRLLSALLAAVAALPFIMLLLCIGALIDFFWSANDWTYSA